MKKKKYNILTYIYKYLINFCHSKTSQNCTYASTINLIVNHYMCLRLTAVHFNNGIGTFCEFSLKNVTSIVTSSHVSVLHTHTHKQNSFNLPPMRPKDRCQVTKYCRLSDSTYTDLRFYRRYFIMAPILGLQPIRGVFNWTSPSATGSLKFRSQPSENVHFSVIVISQ